MFSEFNVSVILNYHNGENEYYFLVYYPEQQIHYIYINIILYIVNTPTYFNVPNIIFTMS